MNSSLWAQAEAYTCGLLVDYLQPYIQNNTYVMLITAVWWRFGLVGNVVGRINETNQRWAWLVVG